jgi:hypothetical protein
MFGGQIINVAVAEKQPLRKPGNGQQSAREAQAALKKAKFNLGESEMARIRPGASRLLHFSGAH